MLRSVLFALLALFIVVPAVAQIAPGPKVHARLIGERDAVKPGGTVTVALELDTRKHLHYLHALRATDVTVPVPAVNEDAVHILTLHQSKGLEFPVVLLPNLAHGQFPVGRYGREEVSPPGFRDSDTPGERDAPHILNAVDFQEPPWAIAMRTKGRDTAL